jgi:hypothetical protein
MTDQEAVVFQHAEQLAMLIGKILTDVSHVQLVSRAPALAGGWEGWLQVELACALLAEGRHVAREQHVYRMNKTLKTDLKLLVPELSDENNTYHMSVELKVESVNQAATFPGIIFDSDIHKVAYLFEHDIIGACGIMVLLDKGNIKLFDDHLLGAKTGGQRRLFRLPADVNTATDWVIYWWGLEVNPNSGKAIVTWNSAEVFFHWLSNDHAGNIFEAKS